MVTGAFAHAGWGWGGTEEWGLVLVSQFLFERNLARGSKGATPVAMRFWSRSCDNGLDDSPPDSGGLCRCGGMPQAGPMSSLRAGGGCGGGGHSDILLFCCFHLFLFSFLYSTRYRCVDVDLVV